MYINSYIILCTMSFFQIYSIFKKIPHFINMCDIDIKTYYLRFINALSGENIFPSRII